MSDGLFHYTSIDTLEKILTNQTIAFKTLALVDDLDEVETADLKDFGRFCYVSCWTKEEKESIPMWKMYTPDMQGVRIKLKEMPFKKYIIMPNQLANKETIETYIDVVDRAEKDLPYILHIYPELVEIDYTEREELLYPQIKTENNSFTKECESENEKLKTTTKTNKTVNYNIKYIGVFKRKCWSFQKEWRYKLFLAPYTYKELKSCTDFKSQEMLIQRLEDENYVPKETIVFLQIDDRAFYEMEILIGPKATEQDVERVRSLVQQVGIDESNIKKSCLRIR